MELGEVVKGNTKPTRHAEYPEKRKEKKGRQRRERALEKGL